MKDKGRGIRSRSLLFTWNRALDLLVSEVMNVPAMIEYIKTQNADIAVPLKVKLAVIQHFEIQHLTPQKAGKIAAEAAARRLVFTLPDISGTGQTLETPKLMRGARDVRRRSYRGPRCGRILNYDLFEG